MKHPRVSCLLAVSVLAAALAGLTPLHAEPILRGRNLNEENLIRALEPAPADGPDAPEGGYVHKRGIRVVPVPAQPSAQEVEKVARVPAKAPSASVLITFVTDSAELAGHARSSLDVVGKALQSERLAGLKFAIEGHADPRGTPEHNLKLSQARAESVVNYLSSQHRIDRDRLKAIGKGESELFNPQQPAAPENRRVTITTLRE